MSRNDLYKYNICGECRRFRTTAECEGYCLADDEDDETRGAKSAFEEACKYFEKANDVM